jgi:hypothetical protein
MQWIPPQEGRELG